MKRTSILLAGLGSVCGAPAAQASINTFLFTVSNTISPEQPSATVTLWAAFDPQWHAFAKTKTDVVTKADPGWFSDPQVLISQKAWCWPGNISPDGDAVKAINIAQLDFIGGFHAHIENPLAIWSATWTTDDFTPRQIPVRTSSEYYYLYINKAGEWKNFFDTFSEGVGAITVVPAPAAAAILLGPLAWRSTCRKRR